MNRIKNTFTMIIEIIISYICVFLSFFIKREDNYLAFGSWCGELYIDNSRYLAEHIIKNHKEFKVFWIGNPEIKNQLPKDIEFIRLNYLPDILKLLRCKYYFFTQMHRPDICKYNVFHNAVLCLLDHGNTVKKWGMDAAGYNGYLEYRNFPLWKKIYTRAVGENAKYDYIAVSSEKTANAYSSALKYRFSENTIILKTGLPRNDIFYNTSPDYVLEIKKKYSKLLGFDLNRRVILYLPTYRRKTRRVESFAYRDNKERGDLESLLQKYNAVLLEKNHFAANKFSENGYFCDSDNIIKIMVPVDLQEMLLFTDIQISDYSGCYLDYLALDRPIIHYIYDYEEYKNNDSGLYYELDEFVSGRAAFTFEEVIDELYTLLGAQQDKFVERRHMIKETLATYEDGHASEKIIKAIFAK